MPRRIFHEMKNMVQLEHPLHSESVSSVKSLLKAATGQRPPHGNNHLEQQLLKQLRSPQGLKYF